MLLFVRVKERAMEDKGGAGQALSGDTFCSVSHGLLD